IHGGLVLFGCRDGRAYCLDAKSGKLVWRFRAAPEERLVVCHDQLESAWPIQGGVLVENGKVFFAAGRHSEIDGGIFVYALEPASGKVVWSKRVNGLDYGSHALADLLVSSGSQIFMNRRQFDPKSGNHGRAKNAPFSEGKSLLLDYTLQSSTSGVWSAPGKVSGQLLAMDGKDVYGFNAFRDKKGPERGRYIPGRGGFRVFRAGAGGWQTPVPLKVRALVKAGKTVFAAGASDHEIPEFKNEKSHRRIAAMINENPELGKTKGWEVWALSAAGGKKLGSAKLPAAPVDDGMAVDGGRLLVSTRDGVLRCFGKK
ncbi:MAG: outer membrane protein assembly factor BamB family protein, partial [Planctomycetota bacterium]